MFSDKYRNKLWAKERFRSGWIRLETNMAISKLAWSWNANLNRYFIISFSPSLFFFQNYKTKVLRTTFIAVAGNHTHTHIKSIIQQNQRWTKRIKYFILTLLSSVCKCYRKSRDVTTENIHGHETTFWLAIEKFSLYTFQWLHLLICGYFLTSHPPSLVDKPEARSPRNN